MELIPAYDAALRDLPLTEGPVWRHIRRAGTGPVLIMLHGSLGSAHAFWPLFEALPADWDLISAELPDRLDPADLARDLAAFCDALRLRDVILLGTSIGGYIAQFLADTPPVAAVVASSAMTSTKHMPVMPADRIEAVAAMTPDQMEAALTGPARAGWPVDRPELKGLRDFVAARMVPANPPARYMQRARFILRHPQAPRVTKPMLIVNVADDPVIPAASRAEIAERYPDATLFAPDWGGHFPYLTRTADYAAALTEFVGTLTNRRGP